MFKGSAAYCKMFGHKYIVILIQAILLNFLSSLLFLFLRCPSWCDRIFLSHSYRDLIEEVSIRMLQRIWHLCLKHSPTIKKIIAIYSSAYPDMIAVLMNCEIIYWLEVAIQ